MTKGVIDLHCAHERPVYQRCSECEADVAAGKSTGFTPPGERVPVSSAETKSDEGYDANGSPATKDLIPASAFPERIYLQRDEECVADGCGPHGSDTTWCTDKIYDTDVPYVRADISRHSIEPCAECARYKSSHQVLLIEIEELKRKLSAAQETMRDLWRLDGECPEELAQRVKGFIGGG
jgi:hypothetical protein